MGCLISQSFGGSAVCVDGQRSQAATKQQLTGKCEQFDRCHMIDVNTTFIHLKSSVFQHLLRQDLGNFLCKVGLAGVLGSQVIIRQLCAQP